MKFIILIVVMCSLTLDASEYIRSIRLGSYSSEASAIITLDEAKKFLYSYKEFKALAKKYQYGFKITQSNGYYVVVLEPITDKDTVQKLLDVLRQKYPSAYPRKLQSMPKSESNIDSLFADYEKEVTAKKNNTKKDEIKTVEKNSAPIVLKKKPNKQVIELPKKQVPTEEKVQIKEKASPIVELQKDIKPVIPIAESGSKKINSFVAKNSIILLIIIAVMIFLLLIVIVALKRSNDFLKNKNEIISFGVANKTQKSPEVKYAEFNLNSMVEHVLSNIYLQAKHSNVDVVFDIDENIPSKIVGDSLHLGEILINLLLNAVKFSPNGDVTLKIVNKERYSQGILLEFTVTDNGRGMTSKELENIFNTSSKNNTPSAKELVTCGIGLSASKELVEKMGGKMKVRSQKDLGTTFVFTIKAKVNDMEQKRDDDLLNINAIKEKLKKISPKKVLIAEDNIVNHKVFSDLLAKIGIEITFVTDGQEVLNLLKKGTIFDLILMDIDIPIINGYDVANDIRQEKQYCAMPIIALSANNSREVIDKVFTVGMQDYILKPITLDDFYKKIYDALSQKAEIKKDAKVAIKDTTKQARSIKELEKVSGDDKLYKFLLVDFKNIYAKSASTLGSLIHDNKYKEAIKLTASVKDVALKIGAYTVYESVSALEFELERENDTMMLQLLNKYEKHLTKLLTEIDEYLGKK